MKKLALLPVLLVSLAAPAAASAASPQHLITVNQAKFKLSLYQRDPHHSRGYRLQRRWKVAVGMPAHATPDGVYRISNIALNPGWTPPDSSWVPANQRGKFFPANDPRNPIAAAFLTISANEGLGIHGTTNTASLGSRASHGCIRMSIPAVKSLAHKVEVGTPVTIYGRST